MEVFSTIVNIMCQLAWLIGYNSPNMPLFNVPDNPK